MSGFHALLLDIWREACRHTEIERSAPRMAQILAHRLPVHHLAVLAFDGQQPEIEVRAGAHASSHTGSMGRTLRPAEHRRLLLWARRGEVWKQEENQPADPLRPLLLFQPGMEGGEWLAGPLRNEHGPVGALLLQSRPPERFEPLHAELLQSLCEPFSIAMENNRRFREIHALREALEADKRTALSRLGRVDDSIIGADGGLKPVMERIALVAHLDIPVLLFGETGTGKEIVARAIHEHSLRREEAFIRVNCGAIPPELIDSELFGHERGAFTGATSTRHGWFERADKGTLLLDEVGDLPPPAQVRLLRVLQERAFERVGGEQSIRVDVRIVAATQGRVEGPHGAANLLRINPHTLRARMRKLGIDWKRFRSGG